MNETTFENAKVGDRVWKLGEEWGTITSMAGNSPYPLVVTYDGCGCAKSYTLSGQESTNYSQVLFWDKVKFEATPRPKRMVKKVVEGWVNIYDRSEVKNEYTVGKHIHLTKKGALQYLGSIKCIGEPLFIHHEYEVEE